MSKIHPLIGVVAGTKATDALLCESLEKAGYKLVIIHYKISLLASVPWAWKRVRERGMSTLVGNLLLSAWLRTERLMENLQGISPWEVYLPESPSWKRVRSKRKWHMKEESLIHSFKDAEAIVLLDSFRLSHRFFRRLKSPCLQVLWGNAPDYLGDSGGYWAYAHGDPVFVSIVARSGQFDAIMPIERASVAVGKNETLRTIKIKQAAVVDSILSATLDQTLHSSFHFVSPKKVMGRFFYAPTLWTYLSSHSNQLTFPEYAFLNRPCTLYESDKTI